MTREVLQSAAVDFDCQTAMQTQGFGSNLGGDVGVAVAVAANPRGETQPMRRNLQAGILARQCVFKIGIDMR